MGLISKITSLAGTGIGAYFGGASGAVAGNNIGGSLGSWFDENDSLKDAYKQNVRLWNLQNAYNHPKEQMKRLKEAGLNPNLVYGSGNVTGNTSSMPASPGRRNLTGYSDLMAYQQLRNLESQRDLYDAQVLKSYRDADLASTKNDIEKVKLRILNDTGVLPGQSTPLSFLNRLSNFGYDYIDEKSSKNTNKILNDPKKRQEYIDSDDYMHSREERKENFEKVKRFLQKNPNPTFFDYIFGVD